MLIILVYIWIIIFGGWILNLLHFQSNIGLMIMQIFDFLPFLLIPILFRVKKSTRILPNTLSFWTIVVFFGVLSTFTTIYHGGKLFAAVAHFGAMFRFVPIALLIWLLKPNIEDIQKFYNNFMVISGILLCIGYIEIFGGDSVSTFFLPLTQEHSSANFNDPGVISGIFPNTVDYSYFLLISYIIISNKVPLAHLFLWTVLYSIPLFFSGSKAALIIFLLCASYRMENMRLIKSIFFTVISVSALLLIYQFWELFYWTVFIDSQSSRLGYILFTFPSFLQECSLDTIFGVSPDQLLVFKKINSYANAPMMTWEIDHMGSFEDEFYVTLPLYYGLLGFISIIILFVGMYRAFSRSHWIDNYFNYPVIIKSLFTILLIAPLFNQIIILKPFALFFWSWIGIFTTRMTGQSFPHKTQYIHE